MDRCRSHRILELVLVSVLVVGCQPTVALPPDSAGPDVVLDAYLRSLVAGDCDMGPKLATSTFGRGNGELCGGTDVTAYRIDGNVQPSADEVVFSTILTTTGDNGQSIPAGEMIWFYSLMRQPNGAWRITGGGTGP
jgi:hypothetical protein